MAEDFTSLLIAVGILLIPVVLALPLRFWWTYRVGSEPEHVRYRRWVRQVLDAGEPLSTRRQELDHLARGLPIDTSRQGRIEMDVLHPLKLHHFMLLPVLILSPLVGIIGGIVFVYISVTVIVDRVTLLYGIGIPGTIGVIAVGVLRRRRQRRRRCRLRSRRQSRRRCRRRRGGRANWAAAWAW